MKNNTVFYLEDCILCEKLRMAKVIVNSTLHLVNKEIARFLSAHPSSTYRKLLELPDLYQELTTYVLSRTTNLYTVTAGRRKSSVRYSKLYQSSKLQLHIAALINQGMQDLLLQEDEYVKQHASNREAFWNFVDC